MAGQVVAVKVSGDPNETNNGLFYVYIDHLGSTTATTDENGAQVGSITRFDPFGNYRTGGANEITDRGFTGHKHNDDLGLIYMNARYYVPTLNRFASADTIVPDPANPQSFNRYSYGYNNPTRYTDPTGHFTEEELQGFYGENWRDNFTEEWQRILLDSYGDAAAQLGDIVQAGDQYYMLVLMGENLDKLGMWNIDTKDAIEFSGAHWNPSQLILWRYGEWDGRPTQLHERNGASISRESARFRPVKSVIQEGIVPAEMYLDPYWWIGPETKVAVSQDWLLQGNARSNFGWTVKGVMAVRTAASNGFGTAVKGFIGGGPVGALMTGWTAYNYVHHQGYYYVTPYSEWDIDNGARNALYGTPPTP